MTPTSLDVRLLVREFKSLKRREADDLIRNLKMVGDDVTKWTFELHTFDTTCPGGKMLMKDLGRLKKRGLDHILMEANMTAHGGSWPTDPPLLRVVKPRMKLYTGHVTAGGSICSEMLVNTGGSNGWNPRLSMEAIIETIKLNMVDCEVVEIETPYNGRQRAGPLRIDLKGEYSYDCMNEYSEFAAMAAFDRAVAHHRRHGW